MKIKIKEVATYKYRCNPQFEMREEGKMFVNPYLVKIVRIESRRMGAIRKDFVLLSQQEEAYYVLLEDINDIIEIC